jgi:2-polyprenyl-3-methyl-5-hydroxy-6-metoxy-1,4-benzoquinol methylase
VDHSKQASEIFDKLAELYQSKFMDVSAYASELDSFLALFASPNPNILEIACGPGNITKYILSKNPSLNILGIDLAPKMIELAKLNCPEAQFEVMDCRHISSLKTKYDGIILGFCLPYLNKSELENLVKDVSSLLQPDGKLYLSTIEGVHKNSGYKKGSTGDEIFMHYYELADIEAIFSEAYLQIISEKRVSVPTNPNNDIDLIIVAVKQNGL